MLIACVFSLAGHTWGDAISWNYLIGKLSLDTPELNIVARLTDLSVDTKSGTPEQEAQCVLEWLILQPKTTQPKPTVDLVFSMSKREKGKATWVMYCSVHHTLIPWMVNCNSFMTPIIYNISFLTCVETSLVTLHPLQLSTMIRINPIPLHEAALNCMQVSFPHMVTIHNTQTNTHRSQVTGWCEPAPNKHPCSTMILICKMFIPIAHHYCGCDSKYAC